MNNFCDHFELPILAEIKNSGKHVETRILLPPWLSVLGMSHWREALRRTQDTLDGLCFLAGLGTPPEELA